jgi:hypothetical protein
MTVESAKNKAGPFNVTGTSGTFPRDFLLLDEDHLRVIRVRGGDETDLTSGIGHTGIGTADGTVVISAGIEPGDQIYLLRAVPNLQRSDYNAQGRVRTEQVESDLDLTIMQIQDLREAQGRALTLSVSSEIDGEAAMAAATAAATAAAQLPKSTLDATRAPLPTDDETQGYAVGSRWLWQGVSWVAAGVEASAARWVRENDLTPEGAGAQGGGANDAAALSTLFSQAVSSGVRAIYLARDYIGDAAPPASVRRMGPGKIIVGGNEYLGGDDDVLRYDVSPFGGDRSVRITRNREDLFPGATDRAYYFLVQYKSEADRTLRGYSANVRRSGGTGNVVAAQINAYQEGSDNQTTWGIACEAWTGNATTAGTAKAALVGIEPAVLSQTHDNSRPKIGVDVVFKNRPDGVADVLFGSAGENRFNQNSEAIRISTGFNEDRPASGAFTGWSWGIRFMQNSLDQSVDRKAIGIDLSAVDHTRMMAALKLAENQFIIMGGPTPSVLDGFRYKRDEKRRIEFVRDVAGERVVRSHIDLSLQGPTGTILATHGLANGASGGNAAAMPAQPEKYLAISLDGVSYRIPAFLAT